MTAHQTKSFKRKEVSLPLLLGIIGVSGLLILYFSGIFSFAAPISETDKVTVDGVENIGQYLTAMVLHTPSDQQNTPITLKYDPSISGLRIEGNINADAIIIEGITGSEAEKNISTRGNAVLGGKRNTIKNSTNNLVIGTERASISQGINSVVVGSHNTIVSSASNVFSMGTNSSNFSQNAQNIVAIGGTAEAKAVQNALALGEGNKILASNSVLLGKSINAGGKDRIFVWSDSDTPFLPEKSNAFYVNTVNGFGLNTTQPTTQFDIGNAGALKVAKVTNLTPSNCTSDFAGMAAYAGNVFCGCNGAEWVPLASDLTPENTAACRNLGKVDCVGNINTDPRATKMGSGIAYPLWNHEANNGNGAWEPLGWKYSSSTSGSLGACQYNCEIGFHPGADNPEGWLRTGACKSCSPIANQFRWRTAGTGDDNCDFSCKASFKYANGGKAAQSCTDCEIGTWTPNDNQSGSCTACNEPAKLWRDINPGTIPHFSGFTTKGTEANACNFDCAPRYQHYFNGKPFIGNNSKISTLIPSGNACIFCRIGTWSPGGKNSCTNCTNKPVDITYRVNENTDTLPNTASYTTNGDNNNCEWSCNYGLIKKGNSCECRDIRREHLEGRRCEPNKKSVTCNSSVVPQNATPIVVNQDIFWNGTWNNGKWSDPTPCDWKCNPGYKRVGDRCEKNRGGECSPLYHRTNQMTLSSSNDLCAYKNVVNFTATSNGWTWDCKGDEGMPSARCEAYKPNPQNGQCGAQHYECTKGSSINKDSPSLPNGRAWKCSGKDGGAAVQCLECDASKGYFLTNGSGGGAYDKHCGKLEWSCDYSCDVVDENRCNENKADLYGNKYLCAGGTDIHGTTHASRWTNDWGFYNAQGTLWGGSYPWGKCAYCYSTSFNPSRYENTCNNVPFGQEIPGICRWMNSQPVPKICSGSTKSECEGGNEIDQRKKRFCSWESHGAVCKKGGEVVDRSECFDKIGIEPDCGKKPDPVDGKCSTLVTLPVDGTKLVDYANNSENQWKFCNAGPVINPTISDSKLVWTCGGLDGGKTSPTCAASCPSGYSLQNGSCVKMRWTCKEGGMCRGGRCEIRYNGALVHDERYSEVECKNQRKPGYTYTWIPSLKCGSYKDESSCDRADTIWGESCSWNKKIKAVCEDDQNKEYPDSSCAGISKPNCN